jgi:hypothetical protein
MPEVGRKFYESGPAQGIARLAEYFAAQVDAGILQIDEIGIASAQFMEATHAALFKPIVFNFAPAPNLEQIERNVGVAVRAFLAAYRA